MSGPASTANAFVHSIGINTHSGFGWGAYNDLSLVTDALRYIGVTSLRDSLTTDPALQPVLSGLAAEGYTFDFVTPSGLPAQGTVGISQYITLAANFEQQYPGSIGALEGLNEVDIQPFNYLGSSSILAAAQFQAALTSAVLGNSALQSIAIYNFTTSSGYSGSYPEGGAGAAYSDANIHAYVPTNVAPETYLSQELAQSASQQGSGRTVITETGYTTQSSTPVVGCDQKTQAVNILDTLFDAYSDGVSGTYIYELLDASPTANDTSGQESFGIFNADGTPKLAATALHNLTTILADNGTGSGQPTNPLNYTLNNLPTSGKSLVLTKSDGAYDLCIWAEPPDWNGALQQEIPVAPQSVIVNFQSVEAKVQVYDPMAGATPVATYYNVQSVTTPLTDSPLILEIDGQNPAPASAGPATASGTAAEIVTQLSALNADSNLKTVTLTDTSVLPVASVATMQYIIANYQHVLSAIAGNYSFSVTNSTSTWSVTTSYSATGILTSTATSVISNGVVQSTVIAYATGENVSVGFTNGVMTSKVDVAPGGTQTTTSKFSTSGNLVQVALKTASGTFTTNYTNGAVTSYYAVYVDGNWETKLYNSAGQMTNDTSFSGGVETANIYQSGVLTASYVTNADGSRDYYFYGIAGQAYTSEHDHLNAAGATTSVTRFFPSGAVQYAHYTDAFGNNVTATYTSGGALLSETILSPSGGRIAISGDDIVATGPATLEGAFTATGSLSMYGGGIAIASGATLSAASWAISATGTTVNIEGDLNFSGSFSDYSGTILLLSGGDLTLQGPTRFISDTVHGPHTLETTSATNVCGLTIGGGEWLDGGSANEAGGALTLGDSYGAGKLEIAKGAAYLLTDGNGVQSGSSSGSGIVNSGQFGKTAGLGSSGVATTLVNSGSMVVTSGTLDLQGAVSGVGTAQIVGGSALEFDASVSAGQTIGFTGSGGKLILGSAQNFAGTIAGFDTTGSRDQIVVGSGLLYEGFSENAAMTQGTLTFALGSEFVHIALKGNYGASGFVASALAGGGTVITHS